MSIADMIKMNEAWDVLSVRRRWRWRELPPVSERDDVWEVLQQPIPSTGVDPRYHALRAALDVGWRVEEPVYLRPRWSDDGPRVYHFILRRRDGSGPPRLVTVPENPEVERFVRKERLRVCSRS